jgi:hypothetical protein
MNPGDTVRWWTKNGGWRFGHLASLGRIWARVQVGDRVKEIRLDELRPWPPHYPDTQDTTPPARRVKRGS